MQMRKIWGVMLDADFDPRAIADSRPMPFKKSMEGVGTLVSESRNPERVADTKAVGRTRPGSRRRT
jgi:hypothetical protein